MRLHWIQLPHSGYPAADHLSVAKGGMPIGIMLRMELPFLVDIQIYFLHFIDKSIRVFTGAVCLLIKEQM
jgi:hypothetical protein